MSTSPNPTHNKAETYDRATTILLVDDDEAVRRLARIILEDQGYIVLAAQDAPDALLQAQAYDERIDVLVTDVVLPGVSGRDLADSILATWPDIKVLFLSGYTDEIIGNYDVSCGRARFLQKPYTPNTLIQQVQQMLSFPNEHATPLDSRSGRLS